MRSKKIVDQFACVANASTYSTAVVLTAGFVGVAADGGGATVPGEDMGFPSSGTAVLACYTSAVTLASTGSTLVYQTSVNYYSQTVAGNSPTYVTEQVILNGASDISAITDLQYFDKVPLGEAVRLGWISTHSADAGTVSAYLLST